jgi:hypothetical protein
MKGGGVLRHAYNDVVRRHNKTDEYLIALDVSFANEIKCQKRAQSFVIILQKEYRGNCHISRSNLFSAVWRERSQPQWQQESCQPQATHQFSMI